MKKHIIIVCVTMSTMAATPYVCKSINTFMEQMVPAADREAFRTFYQEELQLMREYAPTKRKAYTTNLARGGLAALEIKCPELYAHLNSHEHRICKRGKQEVTRMVVRLGCYDKYCAKKAESHANLFTRFSNYSKNISHSIVHWFGRESKSKTI
jgi:hypothetical protein